MVLRERVGVGVVGGLGNWEREGDGGRGDGKLEVRRRQHGDEMGKGKQRGGDSSEPIRGWRVDLFTRPKPSSCSFSFSAPDRISSFPPNPGPFAVLAFLKIRQTETEFLEKIIGPAGGVEMDGRLWQKGREGKGSSGSDELAPSRENDFPICNRSMGGAKRGGWRRRSVCADHVPPPGDLFSPLRSFHPRDQLPPPDPGLSFFLFFIFFVFFLLLAQQGKGEGERKKKKKKRWKEGKKDGKGGEFRLG